jgi:hypothetical protein
MEDCDEGWKDGLEDSCSLVGLLKLCCWSGRAIPSVMNRVVDVVVPMALFLEGCEDSCAVG